MNLEFVIKGNPIAQQRPRFANGRVFSPGSNLKLTFQAQIQDIAPKVPNDKAICIEMKFKFARPKGHYGTGKNSGVLKGSAPNYHLQAKDLDNMAKFYLDAMNKIIYKDDGQVVSLVLSKDWGESSEVSFHIYDLVY